LRNQYDIPLHQTPIGMDKELSTFYMGKYGMFTCHDAVNRIGTVRHAEDLIDYWIRSKEE